MAPPLLTLGHGTASRETLAALLRGAGVGRLVDVRRFPGSRAHPHVARDALADWLPGAGVAYRWDVRLGGRRRPPADSPDAWWRVPAFRGYAAHMRTPEFAAGAARLLADVAAGTTAVLCSETVWWRCHRRMIADYVACAAGVPVAHLGHDGSRAAHPVAAGARLGADGLLYYDRRG